MTDDIAEVRSDIRELRQGTRILTWAVGVSAALTIATLGMVVTLSYHLGQIGGSLAVLIGHVSLK